MALVILNDAEMGRVIEVAALVKLSKEKREILEFKMIKFEDLKNHPNVQMQWEKEVE
jgi:hypothetical protein